MEKIALRGTVLRQPADSSRVITFRASTPSMDRHGTIIKSDGIRTEKFNANPVVVWGHDAYGGGLFGSPPEMENILGRVVAYNRSTQAFDCDVEFVSAEVNPKAERAFQLVKRGFLNAVSIGFLPLEWHDEKRGENEIPVRVFDSVELAELSIVTLPSNSDCIALSRHFFGGTAETRRYDLEEIEAMEVIVRAGAVLNRANKSKLTQAAALVNEVLATAAKEEATDEQLGSRDDPAPSLQDARTIPAPDPKPVNTQIATELQPPENRATEGAEDEEEDDQDGVYIARKVAPSDAKKLAKWAKERGIADVLDPSEMHTTIVASRSDFPADELGDDEEEISVQIKGIKRLKDAIVLRLEAPKLTARHKAARDKGASHDFQSYQPHITLSYNGSASDLPDEFPKMSVKLGPEYRQTFKDIETKSAPPALNAADIGAAVRTAIRAYLTETAISQGIKRALQAA